VRQQIDAVDTKLGEAQNKHDATAVADLFTLDAIRVLDWTGGGTINGREAIEKDFAVHFASSPPTSAASLFRCMRSATRCPLSRNGVPGHGRATA
jgi:uncharacterized protein (TIGR02246 family)